MEFLAGTVGCKGFCLPSEDTLQDHMGGGGKIPCDFDCRAGSACGSTKRMLRRSQRRGLSVRCDWYCRQGGSWERRHPVRGGSLGLKERQDLNVGWGQRKEVEKKPEGGDNAKRKLPALRGPGLFAPCLSSRAEHNSWNTAIFLINE